MDSLPFGLSVHHFVSSVGADAGFAALIAVAILVLLYFAQARETATLRSRADEADHRVQELEARLADLGDQVAELPAEISVRAASPRAAAAYSGVAARAVAGMSGGAGAGMLPPAAPAGVGAPALAAATRLIPDPDLPLDQDEPPLGQHEPATAALYGATGGEVATQAPATAAGGANGSSHRPVGVPAATMPRPVSAAAGAPPRTGGAPPRAGGPGAPRTGPGGAGGPRTGPGGPGRGAGAGYGRPPGGGQARPGAPARPQGSALRPAPRRSRGRLVLGALVGVLALAAAAVAVVLLMGQGGHSSSAGKTTPSASLASHQTRPASAGVRPSSVTVRVLNGTDQVGLAGNVTQKLNAAGYHTRPPTNFSDQTQTSTVVAYMTAADRPDALAVANALKLPPAAVQAIDTNTKAIACPPSQACTAAVVVTVGRNLASQSQ